MRKTLPALGVCSLLSEAVGSCYSIIRALCVLNVWIPFDDDRHLCCVCVCVCELCCVTAAVATVIYGGGGEARGGGLLILFTFPAPLFLWVGTDRFGDGQE